MKNTMDVDGKFKVHAVIRDDGSLLVMIHRVDGHGTELLPRGYVLGYNAAHMKGEEEVGDGNRK